MLKDDRLKKKKKQLDYDTRVQISSLVRYLAGSVSRIKYLNTHFSTNFKNRAEVLKYLNVKYTRKPLKSKDDLYLPVFDLQNISISTKSYDFVTNLNIDKNSKTVAYGNKTFDIKLEANTVLIEFKKRLLKIDLDTFIKSLKQEKIKEFNKNNYKKLIIKRENGDMKLKIFIKYFATTKDDKKQEITYIDALVLLKEEAFK